MSTSTTPDAKEKLERLGGIAQQQGKEAAGIAKQGVEMLAGRMGTSTLVATVVLWVAWFFLPAGSRGLLGLIGLLAIAAPVARPFVRHAKAGYLNAAPLAFLIGGSLLVYWRLSRVASNARPERR